MGVGRLYQECAQRGELVTLGQRASDIPQLLQAALDRFGRPAVVVSDRWREDDLRDALDKAGVPGAELVVRGMGFKDGGADVRSFRRALAENRVVPVPSLLLRSACAEARTISDPAGNSKLSKSTQGGRRLRARDDAAAAAILAVAAGYREWHTGGGGDRRYRGAHRGWNAPPYADEKPIQGQISAHRYAPRRLTVRQAPLFRRSGQCFTTPAQPVRTPAQPACLS